MKTLTAIIIICLLGCTKYKPDWDQTECSNCIEIVQHWSDTTENKFEVSKADTTIQSRCGQMLVDFKKWRSGYYVKYCTTNGEILHYDYYINYVK
jgi:predicted nucleic acid-binding Zn ribbon protein